MALLILRLFRFSIVGCVLKTRKHFFLSETADLQVSLNHGFLMCLDFLVVCGIVCVAMCLHFDVNVVISHEDPVRVSIVSVLLHRSLNADQSAL